MNRKRQNCEGTKNFIDLREMRCIRETEISQLYGNSIPFASLRYESLIYSYIHTQQQQYKSEEVIYDKCKYIKLEHKKNLFLAIFFPFKIKYI